MGYEFRTKQLVLCDFWGFAEGDRKKQSTNDKGENQNVSNGFHNLVPMNDCYLERNKLKEKLAG